MQKMDDTTNALNWFEIPVKDINRATKFYSALFEIEMAKMKMGETDMSFFPMNSEPTGKVSGSLNKGEGYEPSMVGSTIYLNANPDLSAALARVEKNGGKILAPKMSIGEHGNIAFFLDTEGNKVGLHSIK